MTTFPDKPKYTYDDLVAILRILRGPDGCPWDRVQTHASDRRNFLEEAYEAAEAFDRDDPDAMCEELGDVLLQVLFNIHGAPVGTLCCFAAVAALNLHFVRRAAAEKPNYLALFAKPLLASLLMAVCARAAYALLYARVGSVALCTGASIVLAVAVYAALIVALRVVTRDDLALLPRGEKLAKLLRVK